MRKIWSLILAFTMALGLCVPALAAEPGAGFVVSTPSQNPKAGESFTVTVELTGGMEFSAIQFTFAYNEAEMTCTNVRLGTILSDALSASNPSGSNGAIIAAASSSPMEASGTVATLTFTAKADVTDFGFVMSDVVLEKSGGTSVPYTITNAKLESPGAASRPGTSSPVPPDSGTDTPGGNQQPSGPVSNDPAQEQPPAETRPDNPADNPAPGNPPPDSQDSAALFPETAPTFPDAKGHWGEPFISRAAALGLFKGYADGSFHPDEKVTRAQFVTVLWRTAGSPAPAGNAPFADTASLITEFQSAIAWGYENKYVNGKSDTGFDPNGVLTRQEAMAILFRYSGGVSGMEALVGGIYDSQFTDSGQVADWARAAMHWGIYHSLISGTGADTLSPGSDATRAQLAKIMVQYIDEYQKEAGN